MTGPAELVELSEREDEDEPEVTALAAPVGDGAVVDAEE